jgi:hypothetical protein
MSLATFLTIKFLASLSSFDSFVLLFGNMMVGKMMVGKMMVGFMINVLVLRVFYMKKIRCFCDFLKSQKFIIGAPVALPIRMLQSI